MLYSEKESDKRVKAGCGIFYFYSSDEALVRTAAGRVLKELSRDDPEITVLDGPTPSVEEIVLAAGTISFFGGRRLVQMPLLKPSAYSDKDLAALCDTLADTENAVFVITSLMEEKFGRLRPGKREQKLIAACEKLGYCAEIHLPNRAALQKLLREWAQELGTEFAPGAEGMLLDRCGDDQFLLRGEVEKLAALSGYTQITAGMIQRLGTVTLEADTFDMVKLAVSGQVAKALQKLHVLLDLQNDPIMIAGALNGNYLDVCRMFYAGRGRHTRAEAAKDFGYTGKWDYRLGNAEQTAARMSRAQINRSMAILQKLDKDLKSSKLDNALLLEKALCELAIAGKQR